MTDCFLYAIIEETRSYNSVKTMARKKTKAELSDEEMEELDSYIRYEFNHDIYTEITDKYEDNYEIFQPLEFFRLFYEQTDFISENKAKPTFVSRNLQKLPLTDQQKYYFFEALLDYFVDDEDDDGEIKICRREIYRLRFDLDDYKNSVEMPEIKIPKPFDFSAVLTHLNSLDSLREKISYLIEEKTKYEQDHNTLSFYSLGEKTFAQKCQLEIKKLKELASLRSSAPAVASIAPEPSTKKHPDLTLDRSVLAVNYLLTFAKANAHNTEKAKFISFLTGFSENTIRQKLSNPYDKDSSNPAALKKDLKLVRAYFEKLGLSQIASQIDQERVG